MVRTPTRRPARTRRGAILLVVITLLALFAVVGLSFALYADAQATAARTAREAESNTRDNSDIEAALNPGQAFNDALSQLLFGVSDADGQSTDNNGIPILSDQRRLQSGFRGYDFARLMYGQPRTVVPNTPPVPPKPPTIFRHMPLLTPYTGSGLFNSTDGLSLMTLPGIPTQVDRTQVINYAYLPGAGYIIDPEYSWFRLNPMDTNPAPGNPDARGNWYKNVAAPYTYPDLKDLNLAVMNPATGQVLQPSFFRDYAFNASAPAGMKLAPLNVLASNTDWTTPAGRLRIIRPRPADHVYDSGDGRGPVTEFPYPPPNADGSYTGDVINFPGVQNNQRNDSMWIYPGGAIRSFKGKRYTALIAPLIIDLGGRVDLGVAGNRKASASHASSQGGGGWEINPQFVFDPNVTTRGDMSTGAKQALQQLLSGYAFPAVNGPAAVAGRYGVPVGTLNPPADRITGLNQVQFNGGRVQPLYGGADPDGVGTAGNDRAVPAGAGTSPWPYFPETRYPNYNNDPTGTLGPTRLATELTNHPGQYNPEYYSRVIEAAKGGGFGPFLPIDERVMGSKYAGVPEPYSRTDVGRLTPSELISTNPLIAGVFNPYSQPPSPQSTTTDEANITRAITTVFSTSLNRGEQIVRALTANTPPGGYDQVRLGPVDVNRVMPDYRDLNLPANMPTPRMLGPDNMGNWPKAQAARQRLARDIFVRLASLYPMPDQPPPSPGTPLIPLIDGTYIFYVAGTPNPAVLNYADPFIDHGYLRIVNPTGLTTTYPNAINVLRNLAQVAVNIVDYLDPDDVSTTFTWWPWDPQFPTNGYILQPMATASQPMPEPHVMPGVTDSGSAAQPTAPGSIPKAELGNHVVYGTEAPRVLLNEVYAALANNKIDYGGPVANAPFERRFWIELFNPMRADPALSENGLARLQYPAGVFGVGTGASGLPPSPYSPYTIVITKQPPATPNPFATPANVTGSYKGSGVDTTAAALITTVNTFDYTGSTVPADASLIAPGGVMDEAAPFPYPVKPLVPSAPGANLQEYVIQPHSGSGAGSPQKNLNGFCVLGPDENFPGQETSAPPGEPAPTLRLTALQVPLTTATTNTAADITANTGPTNMVAVHLRRLANPYLPPNDPVEDIGPTGTAPFVPTSPVNPYIAVDRAENVLVNDTIKYDSAGMGYMPALTAQASLGRPHPMAASLAANQSTPVPAASATSPMSTFFNHNDNSGLTKTPVVPLKWLVHLDRQLISPIELAHVSAVSPSRLTAEFATHYPTATDPPVYNRHTLEKWLLPGVSGGVDPFGTPTQPPPGQLSQKGFFDMLQARGPQSTIPVGGRTHGKINLNGIWHPAVLRALLDRNDANLFRDADVSGVPNVSAWERMTQPGGLRNRGTTPTSAFPNVDPTDTPFKGVGDVVTRGFSPHITNPNYYPPVAWPLFFNQNPALTGLTAQQVAATKDHTAVLAEPLKKMFNNVTTTSDGFLVVMTIAFFEVRNDPALTGGRVYLGKELYEQVPGDRRYKFAALVDRTQLAIDPPPSSATIPPLPPPPPPQYYQAAATPWQTTLAEDVLPGATQIKVMAATNNLPYSPTVVTNALVYVDGVAVPLLAPTAPPNYQRLRVGYGEAGYAKPLIGPPAVYSPLKDGGDGEELALASLPPTPGTQVVSWANGVATITLAAPAVGYHPAGSPIGNYVLGNPGPQPAFDPNSPQYKPVVPYFARLTGQ